MGFLKPDSSSIVSTSPTTTPLMSSPTRSTCSTSRPARISAVARSRPEAVTGAYSRSQESGTRMVLQLRSEGQREAYVALEEVPHVVEAVAEHQQPFEAHAERVAGVAVGVDTAGAQHIRVHHAAAAPLDPALARADPAAVALAGEALEVDLGGRLGEREVRRPHPALQPLAEHGPRERVDGAAQVRHGDALVDDEALDLVEDWRVR